MHAARHFRRTAVVGLAVAGAFAAVGADRPGRGWADSGADPAADSFNKGTGQAIAESVRLNPVAGGLSFGIGVGESLAGHQNTAATAESRSANLGVIGTTLAGEALRRRRPDAAEEDQPQPLRVESGEEGADDGQVRPGPEGPRRRPRRPGHHRSLRRGDRPPRSGLEHPRRQIAVGPARSFASSGVIDGDHREAIARTEIGTIASRRRRRRASSGMRWEALHRTGAHRGAGRHLHASAR